MTSHHHQYCFDKPYENNQPITNTVVENYQYENYPISDRNIAFAINENFSEMPEANSQTYKILLNTISKNSSEIPYITFPQ